MRSWAVYVGPVQKAIHRIKYKRDLSLGFELAKYFSQFVKDIHLNVEAVIPVPLGKKRLKARGYNQVSMIAFPLALNLDLNIIPQGIMRIRETESQVGLNIKDRKENVEGAFKQIIDMSLGKAFCLSMMSLLLVQLCHLVRMH